MIPILPTRLYAGLAIAFLLAVGGLLAYRTGYKAGSATIQAQWDVDRALRERLHLEALRRSEEMVDAARKITQEVEHDLTARLAAADARGRDLSRRLRDALAGSGHCPLPADRASPGPTDRAGGESGDPEAIGAALADHLAACERDAQRLTDLQTWVGRIQREITPPRESPPTNP